VRKKVTIQILGDQLEVIVLWRKGSKRGRATKLVTSADEVGAFVDETLKAAETA
jgi:hypothetical protein